MKREIGFVVNGHPVTVTSEYGHMLLWILRTNLDLTGTKYGCGESICGACTVIVDGKAVRSCMAPIESVAGKEVVTIEGLARQGKLHPLQQAFIDHGALQCGYFTSGMRMDAYAFLRDHPASSREAIVAHMERNLCRCGAHLRIADAIQWASRQMEGRS
jgi:nicotinate dehydrogenase subunit A